MTLDLLLINPGGRELIYQGLGDSLTAVEPPLWCRLIAGYVRDRGHSVEILDVEVDFQGAGDMGDEIAAYAMEKKPRLVGIVSYGHQPSASTQQMEAVRRIATCLCLADVALTIIVGGHSSALPEQTWRETNAHFVASGEGAVTIERLLSEPNNFAGIPGLVYHEETDKGVIVKSNSAPALLSISELHGNSWDLLDLRGGGSLDLGSGYRAHNWQCFDGSPRAPYASIHTSLGCPYKCSFCCINAPFGGPGYRTRSPGSVISDVRHLYGTYGVRTLKITDEMFVLKPSHYEPICEGLAKLPFADELNIWAYARVDTVKHDTLALLRRAGIRWLALGIESGSAHVRDGAAKSLNDQDIRDVVEGIQKAGISVLGNFIFGLPDDTQESMRATLDLALSLRCEFANFYAAMAYPGSALYEATDPKDLPKSWSGYSQHSVDCTPLPTKTLTSADVLRFRDEAHTRYFTDPGYLDFMATKFGAKVLDEIGQVAAPLHRSLLAA